MSDPELPQASQGFLNGLGQVPVISAGLLVSLLLLPVSLQATGAVPQLVPELLYALFIADPSALSGALSGEVALRHTLEQGQWWRLVSPVFLHFSMVHIAFNAVLFWILGTGLERRLGHLGLLAALVFWALGSNVAQLLYGGTIFFGGLSGVVTAMFGARLVLGYLRPSDPELYLPRPLVISLFVSLIFFSTGISALFGVNVANTAHWSGLVLGAATGAVLHLVLRD